MGGSEGDTRKEVARKAAGGELPRADHTHPLVPADVGGARDAAPCQVATQRDGES